MAGKLFSAWAEDGWAADLSVAHLLVPLQASAVGKMKALAPNQLPAADAAIAALFAFARDWRGSIEAER